MNWETIDFFVDSIYADTREKLSELQSERDTQTNTVRQQLRDLQYVAEREDRLKKEVEVPDIHANLGSYKFFTSTEICVLCALNV